jgi:CheY-like chemotaxis protein
MNLLSPLGFDVIEAENGEEGLEKAQSEKPDLILMDLVMPVLDGFEAVRRLRENPQLQDVVVIAVSASILGQNRNESIAAGCNDFEPKPVQVDSLLEKIQAHLGLMWVYEGAPKTQDETLAFVYPPAEVLKPLFEVAKNGEVLAIAEQVTHIEALDEKFAPFASKIREWSDGFQMDEICAFLKSHLETPNEPHSDV